VYTNENDSPNFPKHINARPAVFSTAHQCPACRIFHNTSMPGLPYFPQHINVRPAVFSTTHQCPACRIFHNTSMPGLPYFPQHIDARPAVFSTTYQCPACCIFPHISKSIMTGTTLDFCEVTQSSKSSSLFILFFNFRIV
jgi:hypothetical protein